MRRRLLAGVRGTNIPPTWQGGLALRYHVGPGPVRVKVEVTTDAATNGTKAIYNTFGYLRGSEFPDEYVYIGGHRDGWGPGAADNVSGIVSVLEAAQSLCRDWPSAACVRVARSCSPPGTPRSGVSWEAAEYVEDDSLRLQKGAVAYFNQDVAAQGSQFGGGGTPSLRAMLRDVAKRCRTRRAAAACIRAWRAAAGTRADTLEPPMGDPGGGSRFRRILQSPRHSDRRVGLWRAGRHVSLARTTRYAWMERFGDPGFLYHATAARIGAAMALRMANADILPYDYVEFANTMRRYVSPLTRSFVAKGWDTSAVTPLAAAITRLERSAAAFAAARDKALAGGVPRSAQLATNTTLLKVERAFARPSGLEGTSMVSFADLCGRHRQRVCQHELSRRQRGGARR